MDLRVEKVRSSGRKREVQAVYTAAFPQEERMPFGLMMALSYLWHTEFLAYYDGETLCGFVYAATIGRQTFILFFAVDEALRSQGYGGRILAQVQAAHPRNKIIVSIEPCGGGLPQQDLRLRRKRFYLANGYQETGYRIKLGGVTQEVLVKNGVFEKGACLRFFLLYSNLTVIPKIWRADA